MAKATLVHRRRSYLREGVFAEIVIWRVPAPVRGSLHGLKYSLALIADGKCVLRYDNEAGKGDHRHVGEDEFDHVFTTIEDLLIAFGKDVKGWLHDNA